MKYIILSIILLSVFINLSALVLDINEVRSIALESNPELLAEEYNLKASETDKWNAASGLIPSASLDGSITRFDPKFMLADEQKSYGLSVSQPIFNGGKIWINYRIKNDLAKLARAGYEDKKYGTIATAENYFFQVMEAKDMVEIAEDDLKTSVSNLAIAEANYESGVISKGEYSQIQSEKSTKEVSLLQTKSLLSTYRLQLANFLQIDRNYELLELDQNSILKEITLIQEYQFAEISSLMSGAEKYLIENNSTLAIAELNRNISKKAVWLSAGNFLPSLNLSFSKSWDKYDYQDEYDDSQRLMLIASVPIFPIADNVTGYIKAKHDLKSTNYNSVVIEDGIKLSLENSLTGLITTAKSVESAKLAKEYAEETYMQAQERFRNGMISTSDLIAIDAMYKSAQRNYIKSIYDYLRNKSTILRLVQIDNSKFLELFDR